MKIKYRDALSYIYLIKLLFDKANFYYKFELKLSGLFTIKHMNTIAKELCYENKKNLSRE